MPLTLDAIHDLLQHRAHARYGGEAVSQREHALQCAQLAADAGEPDSLVVACLLHDLGHLLVPGDAAIPAPVAERDDLHQFRALPFLRGLVPDSVLEPIRMHVDAKRYLCHADPAYHAGLSPASQRSLQLQGGVFDARQAADFIAQPHAMAAVRLRLYDDQAKTPGLPTPPVAHYLPMLAALAGQARGERVDA